MRAEGTKLVYRVLLFSLVTSGGAGAWWFFFEGNSSGARVALLIVLLTAGMLQLVRAGRDVLAARMFVGLVGLLIGFAVYENHGATGYTAAFLVVPLQLAALLLGVRATLATSGLAMVYVVGLVLLLGDGPPSPAPPGMRAADYVILFLLCGTFAVLTVRNRQDLLALQSAAARTAEEASRAKSTFLANTSHELRTPLTAIIGYAELLREELDERDIDDVDRIVGAGRHLLALIDDVLDMSKIEAGRMHIAVERFDVAALCHDVLPMVAPIALQNHDQLVVDVASGCGEALADRARTRQVLLNLLTNAAKFTESGTVRLEAARLGDRVRFRVVDDGIGIAPDVLPRLFTPFTQAEPTTARKFGGTGLGLALSREFAIRMGGTLTAESRPGFGSSFSLELPAAPR